MQLYQKLQQLEQEQTPIKVAIIGGGQTGSGMISLLEDVPGIEACGLADHSMDTCFKAFLQAGYTEGDLAFCTTPAEAQKAQKANKKVLTAEAGILIALEDCQVIIEATGSTESGPQVAMQSILGKKHVVMLNVETDITVGPILRKMAEASGVVYTGAAGDEPAATMELLNFAWSLGMEVVACGKGKNNPLDRGATPQSVEVMAREKGTSARMLTEFVDGTKTMVEMTALSNATGFIPDIPGMHGPRANVQELDRIFIPRSEGGILSRTGVVDYSIGDVAPGVFAIVTTRQSRVHTDLQYLKIGDGPYYLLYRPFHLAHLETPLSAARAVLYGEETIQPGYTMHSECIAVAKDNLQAGSIIDGIGGYTVYGFIECYEEARAQGHVPIGLVQGGVLKEDVAIGEPLTYKGLEMNPHSVAARLRFLQDRQLHL